MFIQTFIIDVFSLTLKKNSEKHLRLELQLVSKKQKQNRHKK